MALSLGNTICLVYQVKKNQKDPIRTEGGVEKLKEICDLWHSWNFWSSSMPYRTEEL